MSVRCVLALGIAAGLGLVGCGGAGERESQRPHILLITADTLRADHLSCHGYPRDTTPNIDAFAAGATRFAEAVTVIPKTCPSFTTVFSGLHPDEHGVLHNRLAVPGDAPLAAELLRSRGYRTAAFLGNPVLREEVGLNRGFDEYRLYTDGDVVAQVNEAFAEWAAQPWDRPTFVWLHYLDPHGPYTPPPEIEALFEGDALDRGELRVPTRYAPQVGLHPNKVLGAIPIYQNLDGEDRAAVYVRRYDAEIRSMDAAFGATLELLREREIFDDAAIFFLSDHGESLGEHDYWFEHGWFAYDATLRVPLIVKQPGQTAGRVVEQQVSLLDVYPTLLDLAGLPEPDTLGASLLGDVPLGRAMVVQNSGKYPRSIIGLRERGQKFLRDRSGGQIELYDLDLDPAEAVNLRESHRDQVRDARQRLLEEIELFRPPSDLGGREREVSGARAEQLRALGYDG